MLSSINYQKICANVTKQLPDKQKAVLEKRFGLNKHQKQTLQNIGDVFGITRERVRQIENEALAKLKQAPQATLGAVIPLFIQCLEKSGGVKREDILLAELGGERFQNEANFLLTLGGPFYYFPETEETFSFWGLEEKINQKIKVLLSKAVGELEFKSHPLAEGHLLTFFKDTSGGTSFLEISKKIERGPLGAFGLVEWPEIKPRGVRDAAFVVLKKEEAPLHFRKIAQKATALVGSYFRGKEILPQTVHNELIRDPRFVLVGRGIYALKEWGYSPGTVKEVICRVLKESEGPLSKEEILSEVQKQRLVKANTVLLNLADKACFNKDQRGRYCLSPNYSL